MSNSFTLTGKMEDILSGYNIRRERDHTPFRTGYDLLDNELGGGLEPGQVHLLCAQPGVGKTSWGINLGLNTVSCGKPVIFISAELPELDFVARVVNIHFGSEEYQWRHIKNGQHNNKIREFFNDVNTDLIYILDGTNPERVLDCVEHAKESSGRLPLIILDYLQLVSIRNMRDGETYRTAIDRVSSNLVELANQTGAGILAISSIARDKYNSNNQRSAVLSMGKESGQLEFDAATVCGMLDKGSTVDEGVSYRTVEFIIAKNRYYRCGNGVQFSVHGSVGRFEEICAVVENTDENVTNRVMAYLAENENVTKTQIRDNIVGKNTTIAKVVDELIRQGAIEKNGTKLSVKGKANE